MKIFLATWLFEPAQARALTRGGHSRRLLSFFHLQTFGKDRIREYVRRGRVKKESRK